ncbi:hypothetical protein BGZ98_009521 [Dissophora globulifera]|nr:hypothetical protein BGZ98_009521 [Dissophora globulifera]
MPPHPDPTASNFTSIQHSDTYPAIAHANHQGRTVLITGASKGIGRATAISFTRAGAANIVIAARSGLDEVEKELLAAAPSPSAPPQIIKLQMDVVSEASVAQAVERVKQACGHLDILVNNAGYSESWKPVAESDPVDWWRSWEVNLKGVYLVTRAFLPLLLQGSQKTIINVSSLGAHTIWPGASAYQTNKFALLRLTEFLAADSVAWLTQHHRLWLSGRYVSVTWDLPELMTKQDEIVEGDKLKMRIVI